MLQIKTRLGPSKIPSAGKGLFAAQDIKKDMIIWLFDPKVDAAYTDTAVQALSEPKRAEVLSLYHSYKSKQTGRYIDSGDDAIFMNHSSDPNVGSRFEIGIEEDVGFALRDIREGEELTIDYAGFAVEGANF